MGESVPIWLGFAVALVAPMLGIIGFWMNISSRLTAAESDAKTAKDDAEEASRKAEVLSASFGLYREHIASNYIHRDVMREVEDRLMQAIDRLADRLDRVLESKQDRTR
jgi:hypothetical protein